jgi:16S rRNA (cytosine967-C5)-methyltransferase
MAQPERGALDRLVKVELRRRPYLNSAERRWVSDAVYGSVRFWRRQSWLLDRAGSEARPRQRIDLWLVQTSADGESLRDADELPGPESPAEYLRVTLSFPDDLADALERLRGADAIAAAEALNCQAPTTLRVNTLQTTRSSVLESLAGSTPTGFSPWGVDLGGRKTVSELPGFREGWFEVQEEASQLIALLTDAQPGQTIVDVGAGAGGKSLAIAAMMSNDGLVAALDTSRSRLEQLEPRRLRAGAKIVRPIVLDTDEAGRWQLSGKNQRKVDRLTAGADCVLVDAPCTGSGVLRRSPDLKWRDADAGTYAALQAALLEQSAAFVAEGGCLVYATCAFERAQDEDVVDRFLNSATGREFRLAPALDRLKSAVRRAAEADTAEKVETAGRLESLMSGPFLRTWPHLHGLDAFFAACLVRGTGS